MTQGACHPMAASALIHVLLQGACHPERAPCRGILPWGELRMDKNFQKQNKLSSELAETMQRMDYELWLFEMRLKKKEVREIFLDFHLFTLKEEEPVTNLEGIYEPENYSIREASFLSGKTPRTLKIILHKDYDIDLLKRVNWVSGGIFSSDSQKEMFFLHEARRNEIDAAKPTKKDFESRQKNNAEYHQNNNDDCRPDMEPFILMTPNINTKKGQHLLKKWISPRPEDVILIITPEAKFHDYLIKGMVELGFKKKNIAVCDDVNFAKIIVENALIYPYICVAGEELLSVMNFLKESGLLNYLKYLIQYRGARYIGAGVGVDIAGSEIFLKENAFLKKETTAKKPTTKDPTANNLTTKDPTAKNPITKNPVANNLAAKKTETKKTVETHKKIEGLELFNGMVLSESSLSDLIRCCYEKTIQELNSYEMVGFVEKDSIIKFDPEKTYDLEYLYYSNVKDFDSLALFLTVAKNTPEKIIKICNKDSLDECAASTLALSEESITIVGETNTIVIKSTDILKIVPAYHVFLEENFEEHYYAFRITGKNEEYYDIIVAQ